MASLLGPGGGGAVLSLMVINKSGGLIYNRDFVPRPSKLDVSDSMRLGSIWFSLHTISRQLCPKGAKANCTGLKRLHADTFDLHALSTQTGTLFFIITQPSPPNANHARADAALQAVYAAYADYVLKNPFYETEMPIRCELFDAALSALFPSS